MTPAEIVLGGICVSIISGSIGSYFTSKGKVNCSSCSERRSSCIELINEKLSTLEKKLDLIINRLQSSNMSIF